MEINELRKSKFTADGSRKSCPRCSVRAGRRVYKKCPDNYSERTMPNGDVIPQSWCNECRSTTQERNAAR